MYYGAIKEVDIADGEGVRVSLFVSGCRNCCKGCFQKETWNFCYGRIFTKEIEDHILDCLRPDFITGLSVLGGEPFEEENQAVLAPFLERVKEAYPQKDIWCFTGYIFDKDLNRLGSIHFNHGTGPRHGIFSKDGQYLYLASELSNELFVISSKNWEILSSISILPNGEKNRRDTAAIRLSDDESKVYISTRTMDIISVVDLKDHVPTLIQTVSCGGRHPRDFILLDGYLLSANRFTNDVVSFRLNEDGTVGEKVSSVSIPEAVSLVAE